MQDIKSQKDSSEFSAKQFLNNLELAEFQLKEAAESYQILEKENEYLKNSEKILSECMDSLKDSNASTIASLSEKIFHLEKLEKKQNETIEFQQYIYNKLQSDYKAKGLLPQTSPKLMRQNTSPSFSNEKSLQRLKKLFENKTFDSSIAAMIGVELDEEDPEKFLDKIMSLKQQRDSQYVVSQKYEDLISELKDVLNEEDEYNLLKLVVSMQKKLQS